MTEPLDDATQKLLLTILRQTMNAGMDLNTVEGQNEYRSTLEFSRRQKDRCETTVQTLTKYGVVAVAGGTVMLVVAGFWSKAREMMVG